MIESEDWLTWQACWLQGGYSQMMGGGGESMLFGGLEAVAVEAYAVPEESTYEQRYDLANIIWRLESVWLTEPDMQEEIDPGDWQRFMEALYYNFLELQTGVVLIE